ncbi:MULTISPECIES: hypothetical protein [Rahnella]|uniref:MotA/TolQ/ExbB proton channel domain-containing protein n=1 Tax=Rahnella laticis TaxID=2787622 RepID=A0ABS0EA67_9GAMM|nr:MULTISPECIES: hypothetical protein [Rahnella]MBF7981982.1 hypothetical protein [Rahnella laticis]MBF8002072.1 hypothetical protein [Rahnella sp. LAC-M12]
MSLKVLMKKVSTYFVLAVLMKIGLSVAGLVLNDPKWLGFILPITVMLIYWVVGYQVRKKWDHELTKAKFADSMYYLGFLFTVASIIICLIDIARIGDSLNFMAIRFGAAMVSTAIGMFARVVHTGFQIDANDAVMNMEERVLHSAESLAIAFDNAHHDLELFRDKVTNASQEAILGVQEQIEQLYTHCINTMDTYFVNATQSSNDAFALILEDAKSASFDLLKIINTMSDKSATTMSKMESDTIEFGEKARKRLEQTMFPDDIFVKKLNPSIDTLSGTTDNINQGIVSLADDVKTATRQIGNAIKGINTKTAQLEASLLQVSEIVVTQEKLVETLDKQNHTFMQRIEQQQNDFLDAYEEIKNDSVSEIKIQHRMIDEFISKLETFNQGLEKVASVEGVNNELLDAVRNFTTSQNENAKLLHDTLSPLTRAVEKSNDDKEIRVSDAEDKAFSMQSVNKNLINIIEKIDTIYKDSQINSSHDEEHGVVKHGTPENASDVRVS